MIPDRLDFLGIVCGLGPMDEPGALSGMTAFNRFSLRLTQRAPRLARAFFRLSWFLLRVFPGCIVEIMSLHVREPDRTSLRETKIRNTLKASFQESVRQGIRGPFQDLLLYSRPWGFDLEDIQMEVHLWHGNKDAIVPPSMGRHMRNSLSHCRATFYPHEGHFSMITRRQQEILQVVASHLRVRHT
jgi:pimeloyl-ACP methyl ester carboxylesterase